MRRFTALVTAVTSIALRCSLRSRYRGYQGGSRRRSDRLQLSIRAQLGDRHRRRRRSGRHQGRRDSIFLVCGPDGPTTVTGTAHAQTDWLASATGRLGFTWDRVMLYAKGGAAWAGDKYSADLPAFNEHIETSVTRLGWTVGGGIEWAFWNNWSAKVEYDFYDFGTRNLALPGTIFGVPEVIPGVDIKETISTVKFGVNYRFY